MLFVFFLNSGNALSSIVTNTIIDRLREPEALTQECTKIIARRERGAEVLSEKSEFSAIKGF